MSVKDKKDYKAILSSFVYGGVDNMPEEEVQQEIDDNDNQQKPQRGSAITKVIMVVVWIVVIILGLFLGIFGIFYLWYIISNKDDNLGFQDFIIEKTSGKKVKITKKDDTDEILQELDGELSEPIQKDAREDIQKPKAEEKKETKTNQAKTQETKKSEVPDWLGSNKPKSTNTPSNNKPANEGKKDDGDIPDWLKSSMPEDTQTKSQSAKKPNEVIETVSKNDTTNTKIES
jgi:hypothetical protein